VSADLAAGIRRVKGVKKLGVRLGNWLTAEQGKRFGKRLIASGSRENETALSWLSCSRVG